MQHGTVAGTLGHLDTADAVVAAAAYREALSIMCLWDASRLPAPEIRRSMFVAMMEAAERNGFDRDTLTIAALAGSGG